MTKDIVISVKNVSKAYRLWTSPAARLTAPILEFAATMFPSESSIAKFLKSAAVRHYRDFWALKDINFEVKKGECIGIIGRNGSGKSTLLQIIAGTLLPSSGSINIQGRVAALLELGSGFNYEFTGRENVYLNCSVLGMSHAETDAKIDHILAFAEIGDFIDQPVKTYSSGMQLRLAFSVHSALDPEVLIVDEAMSVGDEAFSRKCIGRINQLKNNGTSILLVSHSSNLVATLCNRAVLLESGNCLFSGAPKEVVAKYHRILFRGTDTSDDREEDECIAPNTQPSSKGEATDESYFDPTLVSETTVVYEPRLVRIAKPRILNSRGQVVNCLVHGLTYKYVYDAEVLGDCFSTVFMCGFKSKEGFELGGLRSHPQNANFEHLAAGTRLQVEFTFECKFLSDTFFLNAGVMGAWNGEMTYLHRLVDIIQFRVLPCEETYAAGQIAFGQSGRAQILVEESK